MLEARRFACKILETNELFVNHCYDLTYFDDFPVRIRERHNPEAVDSVLALPLIICRVSRISVEKWVRFSVNGSGRDPLMTVGLS